jgi:hypothetical protein
VPVASVIRLVTAPRPAGPLLRAPRRVHWLGSLDQLTRSTIWRPWRALVALGEREEADSQVWYLPAVEPLTGRQFLTLVYESAGLAPKVGVAPYPMIRLVGVFGIRLRRWVTRGRWLRGVRPRRSATEARS